MPSHPPQSTLLKKQPVLRNSIIIVYRDGSCRIIALIKSQFISISPSNKMGLSQKADRPLHSCGGSTLTPCSSSQDVRHKPCPKQSQTGMAAQLDTAVRDAVCHGAQGLITFLTAGVLYSPEENRLTKQLLFHLLRKTG